MSEIKVGSEWDWYYSSSTNVSATVIFTSSKSVLISICNGREQLWGINDFLIHFKPAPVRRTVWLNVYDDRVAPHKTKGSADYHKSNACLFQQEVELIDPREGEKG